MLQPSPRARWRLSGKNGTKKCYDPVTGQAIHYDTFIRSIQAQEYGLFPYHIIYLTPLTNKSGGGRHIAENISWVTELGNRLLGADSVEKIVGEIFAIADYHKTSTNTLRPHSINYYTCFISYSSKDQDFAEKLYADLQSEGVHCWFAPESLKTGDFFGIA